MLRCVYRREGKRVVESMGRGEHYSCLPCLDFFIFPLFIFHFFALLRFLFFDNKIAVGAFVFLGYGFFFYYDT
ncbi:hypothetical protein HOY80DRAFT_391286 [Tuber brumale]|nr:hypothetical protein HOY80DRAFT_391286 [Tuber brumale]